MGQDKIFLDTIYRLGDVQEGALNLSKFFAEFDTSTKRLQLLKFECKILQALKLVPSSYLQERLHDPFFVKDWIYEASFYTNLRTSLTEEKRILDPSDFYDSVWQASSAQEIQSTADELYSYVLSDGFLIAFSGDDLLLAEGDVWGADPISGLFLLLIGGFILIVDSAGKVIQSFPAKTNNNDRSEKEKETDEAIKELLEGAVVTDKKKGIFDKPGGLVEADKEFDKLAEKIGQTPKDQGDGKRSIDLPDGGSAGINPRSSDLSGNRPSIQINLSRGRGHGKRLKIRFKDG